MEAAVNKSDLNGSSPAMMPGNNGQFPKMKFDFTINVPAMMLILGWAVGGAWWLSQQAARLEIDEQTNANQQAQIQHIIDNQGPRGERIAKLEEGQDTVLRMLTEILHKLDDAHK